VCFRNAMPRSKNKFIPVVAGALASSAISGLSRKKARGKQSKKISLHSIVKKLTSSKPSVRLLNHTPSMRRFAQGEGLVPPQRLTQSAAPASFGAFMTSNTFQVGSGRVQKADVDDTNGLRVCGSGCLSLLIAETKSSNLIIVNAVSTVVAQTSILPTTLDLRLGTFTSLYTKYCIRRLSLRWVPLCPTSTSDGYTLGFLEDASTAAGFNALTAGRCQALMDQRVAMTGSWFQPGSLNYKSDGTSTYECAAEGGDAADDFIQLWLGGVRASEAVAPSNNSYGRLMCDYCVDFYLPRQPLAPVPPSISTVSKYPEKESNEKDVKRSVSPTPSLSSVPLGALSVPALRPNHFRDEKTGQLYVGSRPDPSRPPAGDNRPELMVSEPSGVRDLFANSQRSSSQPIDIPKLKRS